jgi:hypothetical protein
MTWAEHVARIMYMKNALKPLDGKVKGKEILGRPGRSLY